MNSLVHTHAELLSDGSYLPSFDAQFRTRISWEQFWETTRSKYVIEIENLWLYSDRCVIKVIYELNTGIGRINYYEVNAIDRNIIDSPNLKKLYENGNDIIREVVKKYLIMGYLKYTPLHMELVTDGRLRVEDRIWFMSVVLGGGKC